ncbi:hypothetical protein JCM8547_002136 [Rhodosporidiobolus lusitaniae]
MSAPADTSLSRFTTRHNGAIRLHSEMPVPPMPAVHSSRSSWSDSTISVGGTEGDRTKSLKEKSSLSSLPALPYHTDDLDELDFSANFSKKSAKAVVSSYPPSSHSDLEKFIDEKGVAEDIESGFVAPDGGLKAWLSVLGGFLILFAGFGVVNSWGVFQAYYQLYVYGLTETASTISWVGSCQLALFFIMALVAGPLFDKGQFRLLIATGSALWITSIFLIPQATKFWQTMLVQGILGGLGVGLLFLPALSIQNHWWNKRRNLAIGIVASGSSIGGICFPIMLNKLIANPNFGFKGAVHAAGYVVVACLVIANLIMGPNPDFNVVKPKNAPLKSLFTLPYTLLVLGAMVMNFGLWMPNFYIEIYGKLNGVDANLVVYLLAFFNAGSFLGRTIPNLIADYTGPFLVQTVSVLCAGVLLFFMNSCTTTGTIIFFAIAYGAASGAFISLVSPVVVSLSRDLSEIGLRQGIAFLIVAGAAVGGNPIAGKLYAINNRFLEPCMFAATMTTFGAILVALGCLAFMKEKRTWRV